MCEKGGLILFYYVLDAQKHFENTHIILFTNFCVTLTVTLILAQLGRHQQDLKKNPDD